MAGRPKGAPKTGGRKPGSLNKRTLELMRLMPEMAKEQVYSLGKDRLVEIDQRAWELALAFLEAFKKGDPAAEPLFASTGDQ
jgi:hypothetical protein